MSGRLIRGLPERLPDGEKVVWQGSPTFRSAALHVFHLRKAAIYFGTLLAWLVVSSQWNGHSIMETAQSFGLAAAAALGALAVLAFVSWLSSRTTIYTITDRRVVLQIGMALPMSINIPFGIIESAALRTHADATGDIPLTIRKGNRIAYLVLWPHARAWHFSRPEPTLRAVPDARRVAEVLARALAAAAGQQVPQAIVSPDRRAHPTIVAGPSVAAAG